MNQSTHIFKNDEERKKFVSDFCKEFLSNGPLNLDMADVITTLGEENHCVVLTAEGVDMAECVRQLSSYKIKPQRLLVMLQAGDLYKPGMDEIIPLQEMLSRYDEADIIWGIGEWEDPTDMMRLTILSSPR